MDKEWITRLNSKCLGKKGKPSAFAILDMLVMDIAYSLQLLLHIILNLKEEYTPQDIRNITAEQLNQERFDFIMESFKSAEEVGELDEDIDLDKNKTVDDLKKEVLKEEDNQFWGDYSCILFIQEAMNINIIVLGDNIKVYPLLEDFNKENETIILHYIEGLHFQLVGFFNNFNIQTVFKYKEIPEEIKKVYEEDCFNRL